MYIIIAAIIFAIIFYSWSTIKNIINLTIFGNTKISSQGFLWFGSILLLNIFILSFVIWYYYYIRNQPGPVGRRGFPGLAGDNARDCIGSAC